MEVVGCDLHLSTVATLLLDLIAASPLLRTLCVVLMLFPPSHSGYSIAYLQSRCFARRFVCCVPYLLLLVAIFASLSAASSHRSQNRPISTTIKTSMLAGVLATSRSGAPSGVQTSLSQSEVKQCKQANSCVYDGSCVLFVVGVLLLAVFVLCVLLFIAVVCKQFFTAFDRDKSGLINQ